MKYKTRVYNEKCDCGCGSELMVQLERGFPDLQIDVREDGRHKWHGVWLDGESAQKLIEFINPSLKSRQRIKKRGVKIEQDLD